LDTQEDSKGALSLGGKGGTKDVVYYEGTDREGGPPPSPTPSTNLGERGRKETFNSQRKRRGPSDKAGGRKRERA